MKKAFIVWFTGLSGSGKTTIAENLKIKLELKKFNVKILDADDIRNTLHKHLGFTKKDITDNNLGLAKLALDNSKNYDFIFVPIISPFKDVREKVKKLIGSKFLEVYVKSNLKELIKRDTKGLYKKALNKEIDNLIGFMDSKLPYEEPINPNLILYTDENDIETCTNELYIYLTNLIENI